MKRLVKKAGLFCAVLLLIKLTFVILYKDEPDYRKFNFAAGEYNAVFIGSSRTKHAFIPAHFDFLTNAATKSYNFGIEGALPPYTLEECAKLINDKNSLKFVFIELSGDSYIFIPEEPWRNFSLRKYLNAVKHLSANNYTTYHNFLAVNIIKPKISTSYADYNHPLDNDFAGIKFIAERPKSLAKIQMSHRLNLRVEQGSAEQPDTLNEVYRSNISRLIELAEAKGILICFFIPPRLKSDSELETVLPIYRQLDEKYKLRVAHYDESLYTENTSLDNYHLNYAGAKIFTEKMSEAFKNHEF